MIDCANCPHLVLFRKHAQAALCLYWCLPDLKSTAFLFRKHPQSTRFFVALKGYLLTVLKNVKSEDSTGIDYGPPSYHTNIARYGYTERI